MLRIRFLIAILALPALVSLSAQNPQSQTPGAQRAVQPNVFDIPGVIFSVGDDNLRIDEPTRAVVQSVSSQTTAVAELPTEAMDVALADLLVMAGVDDFALDALSAEERGRRLRPLPRYSTLQRQALNPQELAGFLDSNPVIGNGRPGRRFFLIGSSVVASAAEWKLAVADRDAVSQALSRARIQADGVRWNPDAEYQLLAIFTTPRVVSITTVELEPIGALTGKPRGATILTNTPAVTYDDALQQLPWPLTNYSGFAEFDLDRVLASSPGTLGGAFDGIRAALNRAGIPDWYLYGVGTEGFALIAKRECFDDSFAPLPGDRRWCDSDPATLPDILRAMTGSYRERSRTFVFIVSPWVVGPRSQAPQPEELESIALDSGRRRLPSALKGIAIGSNVPLTVVVYEFLKQNNQAPTAVYRAPVVAQQLAGARYWKLSELQ